MIESVTADDRNVYVDEGIYVDECPPGQFCPGPIDHRLYSQPLSAATNAPWNLVLAQDGGANLRSDGQYLYFSTGAALKRVSILTVGNLHKVHLPAVLK